MGIGMSMGFCHRQELHCSICMEDMNHHNPSCPQLTIENLTRMKITSRCPACSKRNAVSLNMDDFFECDSCHTQYSTSELGAGKERLILIDFKDNVHQVAKLEEKGKGVFKYDHTLDVASAARKIALAIRKKSKNEDPLDLAVILAQALQQTIPKYVETNPELEASIRKMLTSASEAQGIE